VVLAESVRRQDALLEGAKTAAPTASLVAFLQEFGATREGALAHARVTQERELEPLQRRVLDCVNREFAKLEPASFKVRASQRGNLGSLSTLAWFQLEAQVGAMGLRDVWRHEVPAQLFELNSQAVYIPSAVFAFAVVRFAYFYWVWVFGDPKPASESMRSKLVPPRMREYCTLLSTALDNVVTVDGASEFLLRRVTETLQAWTEQCAEQVAAEMKEISDAGRLFH
jgi:hypothetical protein